VKHNLEAIIFDDHTAKNCVRPVWICLLPPKNSRKSFKGLKQEVFVV